jgi:outer membrane murein-binding lipoprotein Lpp
MIQEDIGARHPSQATIQRGRRFMLLHMKQPTILFGAGLTALVLLAGCESAQQKALDQAKSQATTTNTPQQIQYVDSNGATVTETVQPPAAAGQQPSVSTLTTPPPPGPKPAKTSPVITPLNAASQDPQGPQAPGPLAQGSPSPNQPAAQPNQQPANVSIQVPAGTELAIRINQRINVKTSQAGDHFDGEVVEPVHSNGNVVIPQGTPVSGRIDEAHRRGHFKGRSVLELRLTSMTLNGYQYNLDTHDSVRTKSGKGKRTAGFVGGMTGAGMLIGGIATGGVGLAIGGAAGAGAGTALAGATGNRDLDIPAESIVHFRLADPLVVQNP